MNCPHGRDPRSCTVCAPELVERFKTIAEAFAIVRELGRCPHPLVLTLGPMQVCRGCGARRALPQPGQSLGAWRIPDVTARAAALAARADLSNPFKAS
jgi:hypothetical protein